MTSTGYIKNGKYVKSTEVDASTRQPREHSHHRQYVRMDMQNVYRKDIIQPRIGEKPNPEFVAAYPEKAKKYFTEDEINQAKREM